jgi:hypothetical protein
VAALAAGGLGAGTASAAGEGRAKPKPWTFAVIGDIPYGDAQVAQFPAVVDQINADPQVELVDHLGDIKSGSSQCTDAYFAMVRQQFNRFQDPLVHTPGDNEWTDCHRANNGGYDPLERLDALRERFFEQPGTTMGDEVPVASQADQGYPENVSYRRAGASFSVVHIVGSNNGMAPWTGRATLTPEQGAEVLGRTAATIEQVRDTFATATRSRDRAVVLLTQADMFDPTVPDPKYADYYAFTPIVREIARLSASFRGEVYLFNGDSHVYNADRPLATGSRWLDFYGVTTPADNLRRVTVDGSTAADEYLRVTVDPRGRQAVRWTRVPFTS